MTVGSEDDVIALKEIGKIVAMTISEMKKHVRVGMTTKQLDEIGGQFLNAHGAVSAPKKVYNFPGHTCISLNHDVAHGIPNDNIIKAGDLINIDVSAEKNGYFADSGYSFQVEPIEPTLMKLCDHTYETMMKIISSLKHGVKLNEVGRMIEREAKLGGYHVIQNLCSHGIGKALHEYPSEILPIYSKYDKRIFKEGMVITIEPFLSTGAKYVIEKKDGWTLCVPDKSFVAQFEHTIIITKDEPIILTAI